MRDSKIGEIITLEQRKKEKQMQQSRAWLKVIDQPWLIVPTEKPKFCIPTAAPFESEIVEQ